jgi:hypothetical protein
MTSASEAELEDSELRGADLAGDLFLFGEPFLGESGMASLKSRGALRSDKSRARGGMGISPSLYCQLGSGASFGGFLATLNTILSVSTVTRTKLSGWLFLTLVTICRIHSLITGV